MKSRIVQTLIKRILTKKNVLRETCLIDKEDLWFGKGVRDSCLSAPEVWSWSEKSETMSSRSSRYRRRLLEYRPCRYQVLMNHDLCHPMLSKKKKIQRCWWDPRDDIPAKTLVVHCLRNRITYDHTRILSYALLFVTSSINSSRIVSWKRKK